MWPVISLLVAKAIIISVMSEDVLMPGVLLFRIKKALSQGLAEERIKASLDNRGGGAGTNRSRPCKSFHTDAHLAAHLDPVEEVAFFQELSGYHRGS